MSNPTSPESIFKGSESYDDKANRLKENPKVTRMARFLAELKAKEWGYSTITSIGIPIEGTDVVHLAELTPEEVQELEPKVQATLIEYCEGDSDVALFIFGDAHTQLVEELESKNIVHNLDTDEG